MKVALAVWNGRISPVFDVARRLVVMTVQNGAVTEKFPEELPVENYMERVARLLDLEVRTLICGAISKPLATILEERGIRVIPFTAGEENEIIEAYCSDKLQSPKLAMPGCGRGRRRPRPGGGNADRAGSEETRRWMMPKGDGTGPEGKGPATGRRMGRCGTNQKQLPGGKQSGKRKFDRRQERNQGPGSGDMGTGRIRKRDPNSGKGE